MNREYQVTYRKEGGDTQPQACALIGKTASAVRIQMTDAGYEVIAVNFVRFVPDGLPDDGLGIEDIQLHTGCDRKKAERMAHEAGHVKRGRVICVPLDQWQRYMQLNRKEGMAA